MPRLEGGLYAIPAIQGKSGSEPEGLPSCGPQAVSQQSLVQILQRLHEWALQADQPHILSKQRNMPVRGIRGATNVTENSAAEILDATRELLEEVLNRNGLQEFEDIVSAIFTTTTDLTAAFPAEAARGLGMNHVPLLCASEIAVPNAMPLCIRVMLHVNTERSQDQMVHVYLRDAKRLRPDMDSAQ